MPAFCGVACEVASYLDFTSDVEVVAAEVTSNVVPKLWLGDENACCLDRNKFLNPDVILPPEISEA